MIIQGRGLPIGLAVTSAVLCAVVAFEISGWQQDAPAYPASAPIMTAGADRRSDGVETPNQHEAFLNEILSRPLFSPSRRPAEAIAGVSHGLPRLTGIVVAGTQRVAIFAGTSNDHPIVAQAGTHIGGYEVQTVADAGVTVAGPEGIMLIKPIFDANRPSAPAAARAPAARTGPK
jgi:hypothetical protein